MFLIKGDTDQAILQLNKALKINPRSAQATNLLGIAYFKRDDFKTAEKQFRKAIDLDASYAQAYGNLGSVCLLNRDLSEAKKMLEKAISLNPKTVSACYTLGTLLVNQGELSEGLKYLFRGVDLDPNYLDRNQALIKNLASSSFASGEVSFSYAKLYASGGNVEKTCEYLNGAKQAGFSEWRRIDTEKEFEKVRNDPRIRAFVK